MKKFSLFLILFTSFVSLFAEGQIGYVEVQGKGKENRTCKIWYRVPSSYKENSKSKFRVLVFFGGRNFSGDKQLNKPSWNNFADELGIFIVSPSFVNEDYWQGKGWSGRALIEGLQKIKKLYNISDENLFFYGYSAGGQCSNLFPAAMPERTRAYVSHASGVFHKPNPKMRGIPALLTCGDADHARYVINKNFIEEYRKLGVNVLWKSFYNHTHDIPSASQKLAQEFFRYCHRKYECDLYPPAPQFAEPSKILYVGDDIDGALYEANSPAAKNIDPYDAVYFTSKEIAFAWANSAKTE